MTAKDVLKDAKDLLKAGDHDEAVRLCRKYEDSFLKPPAENKATLGQIREYAVLYSTALYAGYKNPTEENRDFRGAFKSEAEEFGKDLARLGEQHPNEYRALTVLGKQITAGLIQAKDVMKDAVAAMKDGRYDEAATVFGQWRDVFVPADGGKSSMSALDVDTFAKLYSTALVETAKEQRSDPVQLSATLQTAVDLGDSLANLRVDEPEDRLLRARGHQIRAFALGGRGEYQDSVRAADLALGEVVQSDDERVSERAQEIVEAARKQKEKSGQIHAKGEAEAAAKKRLLEGRKLLSENRFEEAVEALRGLEVEVVRGEGEHQFNDKSIDLYAKVYSKALFEASRRARTPQDMERYLESATGLGEALAKREIWVAADEGLRAQGDHILSVAKMHQSNLDPKKHIRLVKDALTHAQKAYDMTDDWEDMKARGAEDWDRRRKLHGAAASQLAHCIGAQYTLAVARHNEDNPMPAAEYHKYIHKMNSLHEEAADTLKENAIIHHNRAWFEARVMGNAETARTSMQAAADRLEEGIHGIGGDPKKKIYYSDNDKDLITNGLEAFKHRGLAGRKRAAAPKPSTGVPQDQVEPDLSMELHDAAPTAAGAPNINAETHILKSADLTQPKSLHDSVHGFVAAIEGQRAEDKRLPRDKIQDVVDYLAWQAYDSHLIGIPTDLPPVVMERIMGVKTWSKDKKDGLDKDIKEHKLWFDIAFEDATVQVGAREAA